ncbi:MAG: ribbon-helix-helix domain-containing protein [Anaeromyxobacteraceae bacterium]
MRPIEMPRSVAPMPLMGPAATRLEPMLVRLPPELAARLRRLARSTRIRQSDYLREAVSDLLVKYGDVSASNDASPR